MSESVPTSVTSFAHRRFRAGSTTSFTYLQADEDDDQAIDISPEESVIDDEVDEHYEEESVDLEAGELAPMRRVSSGYSRSSPHDHLLRSDSVRTEGSLSGRGNRTSQKIYIVNEDLTIVVAGFKTSTFGFAIYTTLCVVSLGLAYLVLRWYPRWQVRIIGSPTPLHECAWVVVEVNISAQI